MGRLGGTGEAATNQRVTQLRQILNFAPSGDEEDRLEDSEQTSKNKLDESSTVKWVSRNNIHLTFSFVPGNKAVRYYYDEQELKTWAFTPLLSL